MNIKREIAISLFVLMILAFTGVLFADSETRPKTAAEISFFDQVIQACNAATTGIMTVWDENDRSGDEQDENIASGSEKYPLVHYFSIEWRDKKRIDEAQAKLELELANKMPEVQNSVDNDTNKELEQLAEKAGKAAEAGNFEEMARLQKQIEEVSKKIESGFAPVNQEINAIIERNAPRDVNIRVRIAINNFNESFTSNPKSGKLSDGTFFYRDEDGRMVNESWVEGTTYAFLGNDWKPRQDGELFLMEHPEFSEKPSTSVRAIIVEVHAEEKRALEILNSMNLKALRALVK
ncbi:MAG: hypothetical protein KKB51_03895 [Candidatus Riflebacteria bacterium]|nr:hypothetical protein [Candidatus Riflebacteria bacterium]